MNLKYFLLFALLTASAIAYRNRDDEWHGRRWPRRHQDKALETELETKLAEEDDNVEPLPEDPIDSLNIGRRGGWRRRVCISEGQDDAGKDIKCVRQRLHGWRRRGNSDDNEEERNHENNRPRGWYRRSNNPSSNEANQNQGINTRGHNYNLRRRDYINYNEQSDDQSTDQNENHINKDQVKPEGHHYRSWYIRRHPSEPEEIDSGSKLYNLRNSLVIDRENVYEPRKHHHHHRHRGHHYKSPVSATTIVAPTTSDDDNTNL